MSTWRIRNVTTATEQDASAWGIDSASMSRSLVNLGADSLTFSQVKAVDAADDFSEGNIVSVTKDGVGFFYGRVVSVSSTGSTAGERVDVEVAGPWWWLENLVAQVDWNLADNPASSSSTLSPQKRSRLILGADLNGNQVENTESIIEAIDYAISAGAPMTRGTISTGTKIPSSEVLDLTVAEVVRQMVRWTPDLVSTFDYTTSPPTLRMLNRSDSSSVSIAVGSDRVSGAAFRSRKDLQVSGVVVKFEQTNNIDEVSWVTITTQQSGSNTFGTLVFTVQLGGSSASYEKQEVISTLFDCSQASYWIEKLPWLAGATGVTVSGGIVTPWKYGPHSYGRELVGGAVPSWLASKAYQGVAEASISYTLTNSEGASVSKVAQPVSVRFSGTDLSSGTFSQLVAYTAAEAVPAGLAASLYSTLSVLQWEGQLVLEEEEVSGFYKPGQLLNVTGAKTDWSTMGARIQRVEEEIGSGRTSITCGPAEHLSPQDFVELARTQRKREPSFRISERTTGQASGVGASSTGPRSGANENSTSPDVGSTEVVLKNSTGSTGASQVRISLADIVAALATTADVKLREVEVCDNSDPANPVAKKMLVLGSQMYT